MYLIYTCVFTNEKYLILLDRLLTGFKKHNTTFSDVTYLIITNEEFNEKVQTICENINLKYDVWLMDICKSDVMLDNVYEATCARYNISNYPKLGLYKTILHLDCDVLVLQNLQKMFKSKLQSKFYVLYEPIQRHIHLPMFTDGECETIDEKRTFTPAILMFNNDEKLKHHLNVLYKRLNHMYFV